MNKWSEEEITFLKDNHQRMNYTKLATVMGRTSAGIRYKANQLQLSSRFNGNKASDATFLLSESLETFYWIGFIIADGTIDATKCSMRLRVSDKDSDHIRKLAARLHTTVKLGHKSGYSGRYDLCNLNVYDAKIIPQISKKFDIKTNKTENPPTFSEMNFSKNQMISLLIGFIDGDGCVYKSPSGNKRISILLHPSWGDNLNTLHDIVKTAFDSKSSTEMKITKAGYAYLCLARSKILIGLHDFIRTNKLPVLSRKWDKLI